MNCDLIARFTQLEEYIPLYSHLCHGGQCCQLNENSKRISRGFRRSSLKTTCIVSAVICEFCGKFFPEFNKTILLTYLTHFKETFHLNQCCQLKDCSLTVIPASLMTVISALDGKGKTKAAELVEAPS